MKIGSSISTEQTLAIRALANVWISDNFPVDRRYLSHDAPVLSADGGCTIDLLVRYGKEALPVGKLSIDGESVRLVEGTAASIGTAVADLESHKAAGVGAVTEHSHSGKYHVLQFGDGIAGAAKCADNSIDLLLTDPPYGISSPYVCEKQVQRRLRKDGRDFIMPKGHFGDWDEHFPEPHEWTTTVLPKVRGWVVIFCSHAQIGAYDEVLRGHKFVAVGAMAWQKTNPVPFNHKFKPINAWEAIMVGKRPGTAFNGRLVHNVFRYKSPSPQHRIHPTQKPLDLITEFVKLFSPPKGMILDPFAGGATTVISAAQMNRHVIGFENDPDVFHKAVNRVIDARLPT